MQQLQIIERFRERRGRPMIDRGLKQIVVAKATPVLDGPLPVSTPLSSNVARAARRREERPPRVRLSSLPALRADRSGRARAFDSTLASNARSSPRPRRRWKDDEPARAARERTSGKMERGETWRARTRESLGARASRRTT